MEHAKIILSVLNSFSMATLALGVGAGGAVAVPATDLLVEALLVGERVQQRVVRGRGEQAVPAGAIFS